VEHHIICMTVAHIPDLILHMHECTHTHSNVISLRKNPLTISISCKNTSHISLIIYGLGLLVHADQFKQCVSPLSNSQNNYSWLYGK